MTRVLPPAVFEQSKRVRLKSGNKNIDTTRVPPKSAVIPKALERRVVAGRTPSVDLGSADGLRSLLEYVDELLSMSTVTPEFRLYEWRLRTFHKWIREPGFETMQKVLFQRDRPHYVLSVINSFVTQEYIESVEGQSFAPYYVIALLKTGHRVDMAAFLRKHNWNQIFAGHNLNLTSFFLRVIHQVSLQRNTEQHRERLKELILECFRYLYKHKYSGSASLMVRYMQECKVKTRHFAGKVETMLERLINRYEDKLLRSSDFLLIDNLSGTFVDNLSYKPHAPSLGATSIPPSPTSSDHHSINSDQQSTSSSLTLSKLAAKPTRHTLMALLVKYYPDIFNNLYFLKFIWLKIQPTQAAHLFKSTVPPVLCSQILHDNYDQWTAIGGIKQFIEYIFSTIETEAPVPEPAGTNGLRRPPTPPPVLKPDIFIRHKLLFTKKMPDADLVEFLGEFSEEVIRLADHLKMALEKVERVHILESLFHREPSLKYLMFVQDLHALSLKMTKNDGSPTKIAAQYPRNLELTLQFFQAKRRIDAKFIPNRCLCGFKKSFAAFKSAIMDNRREHLIEMVESESFASYISNVLKSFIICEDADCQHDFYPCIERITRLGVTSEAGAIVIVNKIFTKLPKIQFNKNKMKSVLTYFAEILPETATTARGAKGPVSLNMDAIKDYSKLCPSKRIIKLIGELYLKTPHSTKPAKKSLPNGVTNGRITKHDTKHIVFSD